MVNNNENKNKKMKRKTMKEEKQRKSSLRPTECTSGVTHAGLWRQDSVSRDSAMMQKALVQLEHSPVASRAHAGQLCPDHLSPCLCLHFSLFYQQPFSSIITAVEFQGMWWRKEAAFCCLFPVPHVILPYYSTDPSPIKHFKKKKNRNNVMITHKA